MWFPSNLSRLPLAAVDFEASCLPGKGSFPIEVAVVHEDGRALSWLIRPEGEWLRDGRWDPGSEAVHGIGLARLESEGLPAPEVARLLLAELPGVHLVSDHPDSDGRWLRSLCRTAALPAPSLVDMSDFYYGWMLEQPDIEAATDVTTGLLEAAARRNMPAHRALPDASRLMDYLRAIMADPVPGRLPAP